MSPQSTVYEWDPSKDEANKRKHGIAFAEAIRIFADFTTLQEDERFDYGETRYKATGLLDQKEIVVVYTDGEDDACRLISARFATRPERQAYWRQRERNGLGSSRRNDGRRDRR